MAPDVSALIVRQSVNVIAIANSLDNIHDDRHK